MYKNSSIIKKALLGSYGDKHRISLADGAFSKACHSAPEKRLRFQHFLYFEFQVANAGIRIQRMREQPLETAGFAGSKAALPPPAALQIKTQFLFGIGIRRYFLSTSASIAAMFCKSSFTMPDQALSFLASMASTSL